MLPADVGPSMQRFRCRALALFSAFFLLGLPAPAAAAESESFETTTAAEVGLAVAYEMVAGTLRHVYGPPQYNNSWIIIYDAPDESNMTLTFPNGSTLAADVFEDLSDEGAPRLKVYFHHVDTTPSGTYTLSSSGGGSWILLDTRGTAAGGGGAALDTCADGGVKSCVPNPVLMESAPEDPDPALLAFLDGTRSAAKTTTPGGYPRADCYKKRLDVSIRGDTRQEITRRDGAAGVIVLGVKTLHPRVSGADRTLIIDDQHAWTLGWSVHGRTAGDGRWAYAMAASTDVSPETWGWRCKDSRRDGDGQSSYYQARALELGIRRISNTQNQALDALQAETTFGRGGGDQRLKDAVRALAEWAAAKYGGTVRVDEGLRALGGSRVKVDFDAKRDGGGNSGSRLDRVWFNYQKNGEVSYGILIDEQIGSTGVVPFYAGFVAQTVVLKANSGKVSKHTALERWVSDNAAFQYLLNGNSP